MPLVRAELEEKLLPVNPVPHWASKIAAKGLTISLSWSSAWGSLPKQLCKQLYPSEQLLGAAENKGQPTRGAEDKSAFLHRKIQGKPSHRVFYGTFYGI